MTILDASTQAAADEEAIQEVVDALNDLPAEAQQQVRRDLVAAALQYKQRGKLDPLLHFVDSLLVTARLHRDPEYVRALGAADKATIDGGGLTGTETLARAEELRKSQP